MNCSEKLLEPTSLKRESFIHLQLTDMLFVSECLARHFAYARCGCSSMTVMCACACLSEHSLIAYVIRTKLTYQACFTQCLRGRVLDFRLRGP